MLTTEICASRSCKINLGDYQSFDVFVSMKVEVDEFDDYEEACRKLNERVERAMCYQLHRSLVVRGKKVTKEQVAQQYGLSYVYEGKS